MLNPTNSHVKRKVIRDPITEDIAEVTDCSVQDKHQLSFVITKGNAFFEKVKNQPAILQTQPFFYDFICERKTELILIEKVTSTNISLNEINVTAIIKYLNNLEFLQRIQYQRCYINNNLTLDTNLA